MNDNLAQARGATAFPHTNRICDTNARSRNLRLRSPHLRSGMMERSPLCNVDQSNARERESRIVAFHVSLVGRTDLSGEIYRQIRQAILEGRLRPGERLSPTRELAAALRVSRSTVTIAYEILLAEGFATSHMGAGTFVSHQLEAKRPVSKTRRSTVRTIQVLGVWETISPPTVFVRARFDFRTGLPDASLFPHRAWRRVVARALRSREMAAGVYVNPAGNSDLRAAIARHIGISRRVSAAPVDD